jgi:type II secretory pathway component PulF
MLRWTRNIFLAIVVAILTVTIGWEWLVGGLFNGFSIDPGVLIFLLLIGGLCTVVIWALGLTRLSSARVRQRAMVVLSYVEQAVRLNLPLTKLLAAAEVSEPRWIARRIIRLRERLDAGSSISDALRFAIPGTPPRALALLQAAERMGRVGPELTRLLREEQNRQSTGLSERAFLRSYPVAMILVVVFIVSIIMVFVMPKYMLIFRDFRVTLPPLTLLLVRLTSDPIQLLLFAFAGVIVALAAQQLRRHLRWSGPFGFFTASRDLADVCHVLYTESDAGVPLPTAIRAAADLSISTSLEQKLLNWASAIEAGQRPADAARAAQLPDLVAGLTTSTEGFDFLSRYYAGKFSRAMILIRAAGVPVITLCFGVIVAIVALALFLPMIKLIGSVGANYTYSSWL